MTDPRREQFYVFERAARARFEPAAPEDIGLEACKALLTQALDGWTNQDGQPLMERVKAVDAGEPGLATGRVQWDRRGRARVYLPPTRQRPWCVLHEAAHIITVDEAIDHGPRFASRCLHLWTTLGGWPTADVYALAAEHRVHEAIDEGPHPHDYLAPGGPW